MASTAAAAATKMHLIKGDRHLYAKSDDSVVVKQILATHSPDGRDVDVRPLLQLVEDILQRATPTVIVYLTLECGSNLAFCFDLVIGQTPQAHLELVDDKAHRPEVVGMLEALAYTIHKISCEGYFLRLLFRSLGPQQLTCKCSGGGDAHATTLALFNSLTHYSWDAKVVIALAAFAVSYGEFWLTAQLHTVNPLAKSVALLKQLPDILEHNEALKPRFDALNNLIKAMVDVTKCIVQFKELPSEYISPDAPDMAMALAHIPTAVYWTIRSVVACASQIISLIGLGHDRLIFLDSGEKKHVEAYQTLVRLFETVHIDNIKILKALMYSKDDLPLVDGTTKRRVSVDVLRRKIVMLFISDLDITQEELFVLIQIYSDTHQGKIERHYEVVWLPIIDRHVPWGGAKEETFNRLASMMPWYSLHHPSLLEPPVIKYIRDVWHFDKRPSLVVLDPQGRVVSPNALHMMWIWGSLAFPFTSNREEALWRDETWRLEFLIDEIDPVMLGWVKENRHVCLYGGEDIEWIRRFTTLMRRASQEARIPLEMVYVGKSNPKDRVKKAMMVIANEKLSGYWQDPVMMWFFWSRLESMWYSKMHHGKTIENDPIVQEVMTMLSFDGSDDGWAVVSRGSVEMVKAQGKKINDCLEQFDKWKVRVEEEGFITALANALQPFHTEEHCTRLILPGDTGRITEQVVCAECKRPMEKFVLYRCCND
ncbi:hypothetical protein GW17_00022583 [Ensete ventricosum]|nr:hypothetical protein GW17_00022583 [Ensete ventricosum]